jgi:hypothetical protein
MRSITFGVGVVVICANVLRLIANGAALLLVANLPALFAPDGGTSDAAQELGVLLFRVATLLEASAVGALLVVVLPTTGVVQRVAALASLLGVVVVGLIVGVWLVLPLLSPSPPAGAEALGGALIVARPFAQVLFGLAFAVFLVTRERSVAAIFAAALVLAAALFSTGQIVVQTFFLHEMLGSMSFAEIGAFFAMLNAVVAATGIAFGIALCFVDLTSGQALER